VTALLGPYAGFIVAAYGITLAVVALLIVWVRVDYARRLAELRALEERGIRRRSARGAATAVLGEARPGTGG
jgi:heme exporter protein D